MLIAELPNPFGPGKVQVDVDNDKAIAAYRAARGALAEAVLDESLTALTAPKPWLAAETVLGPETAAVPEVHRVSVPTYFWKYENPPSEKGCDR